MNTVTDVTAAAQPSVSSAAATASLTSDFDTFIQLLTTQVTNQDPLEPLDSTQFVEQLATFSGLEQQIASNTHLESIISLLQADAGTGASLIGQTVTSPAIRAEGPFTPLGVTAGGVSEGALVVRNSANQEVFRGPISTDWSWNGLTTEGNAAGLDTYTFEIATPTGSVPANIVGTVDRVITTNAGQEVGLGDSVTTRAYSVS